MNTYPSNLNNEQMNILVPLIPVPSTGRALKWKMADIINAIFYVVRTGCPWRYLPSDFPPWQTVYYHFRKLIKCGIWKKIHDTLMKLTRISSGRKPEPSAGIIDSQSVKASMYTSEKGYDAGKKVNGIKRHILTDTMGLIIAVIIHIASIQDRDGAKLLLSLVSDRLPRMRLIWADAGYAGKLIGWVLTHCQWVLQVVRRPSGTKGFKLLPRRWVVERTFGWLSFSRRLSKDYERLAETSESVIYISMISLMLRRLAP